MIDVDLALVDAPKDFAVQNMEPAEQDKAFAAPRTAC